MYPFDVSSIVTRLRLDLEQLFQANNKAIFISQSWRKTGSPMVSILAAQLTKNIYHCINDLSGIIADLSKWPSDAQFCGFTSIYSSVHGAGESLKVDDPGAESVTLTEALELANLQGALTDLGDLQEYVKSMIEQILKTARTRINTGGVS